MTYPRILVAMGRDGLLSGKFFAAIHPRYRTPWKGSLAVGLAVGLLAAFVPLQVLTDLVVLGTLFGYGLIAAALFVLRRRPIHADAIFHAPGGFLAPCFAVASCLLLMAALPLRSWLMLAVWLGVGVLLYYAYGRKRFYAGPMPDALEAPFDS